MTSSDTYDFPDSSPDPYDTSSISSNGQLPASINPSSLPSGLPILGPATGFTSARKIAHIQQRIDYVSKTIRRPLTEIEQRVIAHYSAKSFAIASYGPTLGLSAGGYRAYATRAEFRFPFYGKLISDGPAEGKIQQGIWDGQKIRVGGKEILQGLSSQAKASLVHLSRGVAYCLLGRILVPLFVSTYAATASSVGEIRDPRLKEVNRELTAELQRDLRGIRGQAGETVTQTDARREGRMPSLPREMDQGRTRRGKGAEVDDASPTGGVMLDMDIDEEQAGLRDARDMTGVLSDGQMRTAEANAQPPPSISPARRPPVAFQRKKVERQPKDFGSDFDDASPTGGSGAMGGEDGSGGSVWERIRQQSASEPSTPNAGRRSGFRGSGAPQEGTTTGDSFSFSSSDEERSYAQTEAQKEFDERVERERKGGDFSSEGRRW